MQKPTIGQKIKMPVYGKLQLLLFWPFTYLARSTSKPNPAHVSVSLAYHLSNRGKTWKNRHLPKYAPCY
jgi:hypothetical protein